MNDWAGIAWLVVLLAFNGFFVASEFAVISARRSQIEPLAEKGSRAAKTALYAMEHATLMLATCQLGVTLCSTGLGIVAEPALAHVLEDPLARAGVEGAGVHAVAVVLALVIVVFLHVVTGEMVPKNLSIASPERAARILAPAIVGVSHVFGPVVTGLNAFANWIVRIMGLEPKDELAATFNAEEVASIVERSTSEGVLDDDTGLLSGALEFSEETAGSVMVPLSELVVLEEGCTPEDVERAVVEGPPTRARMRGRFVAAAHDAGVSTTVDWVHLKLNGEHQQSTVMCKDPFATTQPDVEELIAEITSGRA